MAAAVVAVLAAGCMPVGDRDAWGLAASDVQATVDGAVAALARGDYVTAESKVTEALGAQPGNAYALLTAATLYDQTGRPALARQAYEAVLALPDPVPVNAALWGRGGAGTAQDLARQGLARLVDSGDAAAMGVVPLRPASGDALMGAPPEAVAAPAEDRFHILRRLWDQALVTETEYRRRRQANLGALLPLTQPPPAAGLDRPVADAAAIGDRLRQLRQAYEDRYISAAQHAAEREIILDSLLPAEPLARAAEARPPETVLAIAAAVGRLERLRAAKLISDSEFKAERARLDALLRPLMPAAGAMSGEAELSPPAVAARPQPKPRANGNAQGAASAGGGQGGMVVRPGSDATALADAARRADAESRRLGPEGAETGNPAAVLKSGRGGDDSVPYRASGETAGKDGAQGAAATGPLTAVHLASFRSQERAMVGWRELVGRYPVLAGLSPQVTRVTLPGKGVFYRLHAAPLGSLDQARALCRDLAGQYCDPVTISP
jgi:hypothetical protein